MAVSGSAIRQPLPYAAGGLRRHVPELAVDWALDVPDQTWRILPGTLCFADISGFTALAERLAQRGRMGGEELVETLGAVFTTMLGIARERGGTLLKFGGDALLLFFQGPQHAAQAASAAVEMRGALRKAAEMPSSVGPLHLSMSVGLHSGDVHLFLVGASHRELTLLGPGINRVLAAENAASAGEIVVTAETAVLLRARAVRFRDDGQRLLCWRKGAVPPCGPRPQRAASHELVRGLFPSALGAFLSPGVPPPEHRVACIAFARFGGTDALLEHAGVEALAEALDATIGAVQQVLDVEGVTLLAVDVDKDGGKLFLASGVPYGNEDDEGLMLRTLRRMADLDVPLPLQMGVNRGHVFVAEVGDGDRAAYSAMGDTTNTAARITARTPAGKIFAHPATLDESFTRFDALPAEPLVLKGKRLPLVVYEVGAELGLRDREGLDVEVFIGRHDELARLEAALAARAAGRGGLICCVGDTGLGKTRLLREATAFVEDHSRVLTLRAEPYGAASAYRMFRDPVRGLLAVERGEPDAMVAALTAAVAAVAPTLLPFLALIGDVVQINVEPSPDVLAIEPRFRPRRTGDVLVALLDALRSDGWIIVADDVHWCDEASADLLEQLGQTSAQRPWLMLVARRETGTGFRPVSGDVVALPPMTDDEIEALIRVATEAAPLRSHEIEAIVRRVAGNPLFAEEVVRAVRDAGSLDAVPESLEAAMCVQIDALDRDARRVLQYASVLGRSFTTGVLEEILGGEGFELSAAHLARLDEFLIADGDARMRFRVGILRDTVYEGLAYRLRQRLHAAAAEAMERRSDHPQLIADVLALHYSRAGDHPRTWHYGQMAGDQARAKYANADAARLYELAIEAARRMPDLDTASRIRVWRELGDARLQAGMLEDALDAHRQALKLAGQEPLPRAEALYHLAKAQDYSGALSSALRDLSRARRLLEDLQDPTGRSLLAETEAFRSVVLYGLDRPHKACEQANEAVRLGQQSGNRAALARALVTLELARMQLHGPGDGAAMRSALAIYEDLGEVGLQAMVMANLGVTAAIAGRWSEAAEAFDNARALRLRSGNMVEAALSARNLGELLFSQGRLDEAEAILADALQVMRAAHWAEGVAVVESQVGQVLIERGRLDEAEALLADANGTFLSIGQPLTALETTVIRASGRIRAGSPQQAMVLLDEALAAAGGHADTLAPRVALLRALAWAKLGCLDEAVDACDTGLAAARIFQLPYEEGLLGRARLAIAGRQGLAHVDEAVTRSAERLADLGVIQAPRSYSVDY